MSAGRAAHRGVEWRRDDDGTITWHNDGLDRWVRWYPGADAPPLPPRWAPTAKSSAPPRVQRPRWASPYRLVPVVLAVAVIVIGVVQAVGSTSHPVASEAAKAEALVGHCLSQKGTSGGQPTYNASPVPCELPVAAVKVVEVLPGTPGAPHCPAAESPVQIAYLGVRYPHVECVVPARSGG